MAELNKTNPNRKGGTTSPVDTGIDIVDSQGKVVDHVEYGSGGLKGVAGIPAYKSASGEWTSDPLKTAAFSISDGQVKLTAPKSLTDLPEFKQTFDESVISQIAGAYASDKNIRVPYQEKNEDGSVTETNLTVPELVERWNESLDNFISNYRIAEAQRGVLHKKYGDKASNLSLTQIASISGASDSNRVQLPDFIFNLDTPFAALKNKRDDYGTVSVDDFNQAYNLSSLSHEDLAGIIATIEGHLSGSDWGEDEVAFEDGSTMRNGGSASEATKALALKQYILSKDPEGKWYQEVGEGAVTLAGNVANGVTTLLTNVVAAPLYALSLGNITAPLDWNEEKQEAYATWTEQRKLTQDAAGMLGALGNIGGMILGTVILNVLAGAAAEGVSGAYATAIGKTAMTREAIANMGPSAQAALTAESMDAVLNMKNISAGAKLAYATLPLAQKAKLATDLYTAFANRNAITKGLTWSVSLLMDTFHDAVLYDATTLRRVIESSDDENMKDYWLAQLVDNAKWWVGFGIAKKGLSFVGSSPFAVAINAKASQKINGLLAGAGDKKKSIQDAVYGGDVVRHLENKIDDLKDGAQKNRLKRQVEQLRLNEELREARRAFANADFEFDGLKLSEDSLKKYQAAQDSIRQIELAIDNYNANTLQKQMEMLGLVRDPATGKRIYVNPDLGVANSNTIKVWEKLADLTDKYRIEKVGASTIGQDIIDYLVGTQDLKIKQAISDAGGVNAEVALNSRDVIKENLATLRKRLPEEVLTFLDDPNTVGAYTTFYAELNNYGVSKGLVDSDLIRSYERNEIWAANGYMPVYVTQDSAGVFVPANGQYHALISQDIEHFSYRTKANQHYVDPELIRQKRINAMAKSETNANLMKAYRTLEDATNRVIISGKETARVKNFENNKRSLEVAIDDASKAIPEGMFVLTGKKQASKTPTLMRASDRQKIIATFSLSETSQILVDRGVFLNGATKFSEFVTPESYGLWYPTQSKAVKNYLMNYYETFLGNVRVEWEEPYNDFSLFAKAIEQGGDDFEAGLQRAYLLGDMDFGKSPLLKQARENIRSGKSPFYDGLEMENLKERIAEEIPELNGATFFSEVDKALETAVDTYVESIFDNKGAVAALKTLSEDANGAEIGGTYYVLKKLSKNSEAKEAFVKEATKLTKGLGLTGDQERTIEGAVEKLWDRYLEAELDTARSATKTIDAGLVDSEDMYEEVKALAKLIDDAKKDVGGNTVMFLDEKGRQAYAEVDPNFASLYSYRYQMTDTEASAMARWNAAMSRVFRFGTTTLNLTSFGNQLFRDTGNALIVGGAWNTIRYNADNLTDVFGESIVEQIKRFEPTGYEFRQAQRVAEQTGQSLEGAAVSRELARGAALSPASTETTFYRQFMEEAYGNTRKSKMRMLDKMENKFRKFADTVDTYANGKREEYLRQRVFANNLNRALTEGYTLEQARVFANFAMNNATTNFSRQIYHLQAIADSTPYFRAAINGTKSFWRMWSLDPVGISGRVMGGLILPTMFLTGASLGDDENRKVYQDIPEYQKQNSLAFVIDKQILTVPIPQEIANIVAPFRQFVEYLYDANKSDFWELMIGDALGFSPVDLTAFTSVDMDKIKNDPTMADRLGRGFSRVFSQVAPVPVKTVYMLATGIDPYTGKKLNDPTYTYWDNATDSLQTMDYNQNRFAKAVADIWGDSANAALIEKVVSGVVGSTGSNLLGEITALFTDGAGEAISQLGEDLLSEGASPYSMTVYDQVDAVWKRAVRELTAEKEAIINNEKYKTLFSQLSQTSDPDKRKAILAQVQNIVSSYQQKVGDTVKRLSSEYGGTLDRKKFGAVIQLLNFNSDPLYQSGTQYSSNIASDAYYEGRDSAVATMEALGVRGTSDLSIFGYLTVNNEGQTVMKYSTPTAIMESEAMWYSADDIDVANLEAKLKADEITKNDMWNGYYQAKAQGNTALKKYKSAWNTKVVKSLAPYISERGVNSVMRNSATRDMLEDYLFIDNPYQTKQYLYKIFGGEE